jgi:hypothetical protein
MVNKNDKYNNNLHDSSVAEMNIKKLLVAAFSAVAASNVFKWNLLLQLRSVVLRLTTDVSRQAAMNADFEHNLSGLMASAAIQSSAVPGFRDRLLYQLMVESEKAQQKQRSFYLAPALVGVVVLILVFGAVIYPNFLAVRDIGVSAALKQGTGVVTRIKPLFFVWGSRVVQSRLDQGKVVSLAESDRIASGSDTMIEITLFNTSTIKLYPDSVLLISKLKAGDTNGLYTVGLKLEEGNATSRVSQLNYVLETPVASTSVLGTNFRTEVIDNNQTYLATDEGAVQLTMEGNTVRVLEGDEVQAIKGQPLVVTGQKRPYLLVNMDIGTKILSSPLTIHVKLYPEAKGTINGQPFVANLDGWASLTLKLEPGRNFIIVTVISPSGKTIDYKYSVMIQNP